MATVPGMPDTDPTPQALRPTFGDLMMAAGTLYHQGRLQLAGDVVPFQRKPLDLTGDQSQLDEYKKMMTRDTLSRALGGTKNVLPIKPEDQK